ncbi:MAG: right-handed parallel beta-helix repeat-containing protein [Lentisphaeria bacterium]|nr:right-handed parallel beta-helix repeat-containing protein [Lentisphaeria bacterium]
MKKTLLHSVCAIGVCAGMQLAAAEYRVSAGMDLEEVNQKVQPGDTVILSKGRHVGQIKPRRSGEPGKPIVYRGEAGALLYNDKVSVIELHNLAYITLENLAVTAGPGKAWFDQVNCKYITVRKCSFTDASGLWAPFKVNGAEFCRYEDILADGCIKAPEALDGRSGFTGANLMDIHKAQKCVFERIHTMRGGHTPFVQWYTCSDNVIRDCMFDSRWARNFEFFNAKGMLIERCIIVNAYHGASSADTGAKLFIHDSIFRRNLIVRNADTPLVANGYTYPGMPPFCIRDSRLYFNTWSENGGGGFSVNDPTRNGERVLNNVFKNNIWSRNNPGGDPVGMIIGRSVRDEENQFRGNVFFGRKAGDAVIQCGRDFLSLDAAAKLRPAMFQGNKEMDPLFTDPEKDVFTLREDSPARDQGAALTFTRSAGKGRVVEVADARYFYDGFGIPGEQGDEIRIGSASARVVARDVAANTLTVDRDLTWAANEAVNLPFSGSSPDPGAYEFGMASGPVMKGERVGTVPSDYKCDYEPEHIKEWAAWWFAGRQGPSAMALDLKEPAAKGKGSAKVVYVYRHPKFSDRVLAVGKSDELPALPSNLSCFISPANWDVTQYPFVRFYYRIPKDVPVGLNVRFFPKAGRPERVYLGGSPTYSHSSAPAVNAYSLIDDGQWHEITVDLRKALQFAPDTVIVKDFGFRTAGNGKPGQCFWFDEFEILPEK